MHNGIIENHEALRERLQRQGYEFVRRPTPRSSRTWSTRTGTRPAATCCARCSAPCARVPRRVRDRGDHDARPGRVVGARQGARCSSASARTRTSSRPTRPRCCRSRAASPTSRKATSPTCDASATHLRRAGQPRARADRQTCEPSADAVELGPYRHYMQKEIFEQPRAVADTLEGGRAASTPALFGAEAAEIFATIDSRADPRLRHELPRGPGRQALARDARAACRARSRSRASTAIATACRTRARWSSSISQSGETADTLAALQARASRSAISTRSRSATSRRARWCAQTRAAFLTRAGAEIGVASTKAFTTQLAALFLLALTLAKLRGRLSRGRRSEAGCARCATCRRRMQAVLALEPQLIAWAQAFAQQAARAVPRPRPALPDRDGRRAQAQGDLLHPRRGLCRRRAEARPARAGRRATCRWSRSRRTTRCSRSSSRTCRKCARAAASSTCSPTDSHIAAERRRARDPRCPSTRACCRRSCTSIPLQLLAYHTAVLRGTDVDKPRNLAKTVTVE